MRLALQALFGAIDKQTEEGRANCERIERQLRNNERSGRFLRKLRSVVSDPRIKAPEIFAEESFPDANIVAEYLDCQHESQEILDEYERVCHESPEILAEVGCCYDILMNRLDKPIEVPKNCRRRLYYIAWEEKRASQQVKTSTEEVARAYDDSERRYVKSENKPKSTSSNKKTSQVRSRKSQDSIRYETDVQKAMRNEKRLKTKVTRWGIRGVWATAFLVSCVYVLNVLNSDNNPETFVKPNSIENVIADDYEDHENIDDVGVVSRYSLDNSTQELAEDVIDASTSDPVYLACDVPEGNVGRSASVATNDSVYHELDGEDSIDRASNGIGESGRFEEYQSAFPVFEEELNDDRLDWNDLEPHEEIRIPENNKDVFSRKIY